MTQPDIVGIARDRQTALIAVYRRGADPRRGKVTIEPTPALAGVPLQLDAKAFARRFEVIAEGLHH